MNSQAFETIELQVRSGESDVALNGLKNMAEAGIRQFQPVERARWAQLVRRAGAPLLALRSLFPYVRGSFSEIYPPHPNEILEYGAALCFLGLEQESLKLVTDLGSRTGGHLPLCHLYQAFALFPQWRYREAEAPLRRYLEITPSSDYFHLVARINLASVHVFHNEWEEAEGLLKELIQLTEKSGRRLLLGNALELMGQVSLRRRDFSKAEDYLTRSQSNLAQVQSIDALFVAKWRGLLELERDPMSSHTHELLLNVMELARQVHSPETIRDIAFRRALLFNDSSLASHLVRGTPYPGFFDRPEGLVVQQFATAQPLEFSAGLITDHSKQSSGVPSARIPTLPTAGLEANLMRVLLSDFYKPFSIFRLWQESSPDHFNPRSSPNLVHQKLYLLRQWLRDHSSTIKVHCQGTKYQVSFTQPTTLDTQHYRGQQSSKLEQLLMHLRERPEWSAKEIKSELSKANFKFTPRTLQRQLQIAVESGHLLSRGKARAVRYKLPTTANRL